MEDSDFFDSSLLVVINFVAPLMVFCLKVCTTYFLLVNTFLGTMSFMLEV